MKNRQLEVLRLKIFSIICMIFIASISIYYDYNFENGVVNGFMLFSITVFILMVFLNQSFYIETGLRPHEKEAQKKAYIYAEMHPWWAIRNQILYLLFYLSSFVSLILVGMSLF